MPLKLKDSSPNSIPLYDMKHGEIGILERTDGCDGRIVKRNWQYLVGLSDTLMWNNIKWSSGESDTESGSGILKNWRVRILPPGTLLEVE